ncbi:MAG: hypothetical protein QXP73_05810 [Candidatus Methanomethylicaceae archaeon]
MDLTWITLMFLPLALIFTLVFSVGILIFLFYSLLKDSEERKRNAEPTKGQNIRSNRMESIVRRVRSLKSIFKFSNRRGEKITSATESLGVKQDSKNLTKNTETPITFSDINETPKSPAPMQTIPKEDQKISEDIKPKPSESLREELNKPSKIDKITDNVTKSEVLKGPDAQNEQAQIKAKPVETLSEVEKIMKSKAVVSEKSKVEVSKSEPTPHQPPESTVDSNDVVGLLGGIKFIKEEDQHELTRVSESAEKELRSQKVERKEKPQKLENNEVELLLRTEEAVDKVEEIQDQFIELRTSLVQLKKTLKKLSEKEDSSEKSEQ